MAQSKDAETPNFADDIRTIRILSFASHRKALLYAGYKPDTFNNWILAADFAHAHGMVPIQATEGGKYILTPDREKDLEYPPEQIKKIWNRASIKYCLNIEGSVKTFICGANDRSIFRRKEIHGMMRSTGIEEINGRSHEDYVRLRRAVLERLNEEAIIPQPDRHNRAINRVFRAIAMGEIRQDLYIAREQNNEREAQSVLARVSHLKAQHREELRETPRLLEELQFTETLQAAEEMSYANPGIHIPLFVPRHAHG